VSTTYNNYSSPTVETYESKEYMPYVVDHSFSQCDFEFAIGHTANVGNHGMWESFAGWGMIKANNDYIYSMGANSMGNYTYNHFYEAFSERREAEKAFLQNSLGYTTNHTEGAIGCRLTYFHFSNQQLTNLEVIHPYEMMTSAALLQPSAHFGLGFKNLRVYAEYEHVFQISETDVEWNKNNFKLGLVLKF